MKRFLLCFAFCLSFLFPTVTMAASSEITVEGVGVTESAAIHDAMRNALEKRIGVLVDGTTLVQNAQVVKDTIYANTEGYITDYSVLSKSQTTDGYSVNVRCVVSDRLDSDIMSRLQKTKAIDLGFQDARIGVIITDQYNHELESPENLVVSGLQDAGLTRIVDLQQVDAAQKQHALSALFHDDLDAIMALKTQFPVDYMVVGRINGVSIGNVRSPGFEGFVNGRTTLAIRMYNMNTGEIMFADSLNSTVLHTDRNAAATAAIDKVSSLAIPKIQQAVMKKATNPSHNIQLFVSGEKLGGISESQQKLSSINGITNVFLRSNSYGTMIFDLDYYGDANTLASALEASGITVLEVTSSYIKI